LAEKKATAGQMHAFAGSNRGSGNPDA
jgi:hypothetical protein